MESLAVFVDEEWDSLSRMFSSEEEYSDHQHFGLQLHGTGIFSGECGDHDTMINIETPSSFWPSTDESSNANAPIFEEGVFLDYYFSQENSTNSSDTSSNTNLSRPTPTHGDGNYHHADSNLLTHHLMPTHNFSDRSMQFYTMDDSDNNNMLGQVFSDDVMEEILCLKQATNVEMTKMEHSDSQQVAIADPDREMQLKRKFEMSETPEATKDDVVKIDPVDKNPKKKQRVPKDNKTKKNAQSKKNQKVIASETDGHDGESETNNGGGNGQSSSSFSSEDDSNSNSNASQESNGGALNLNGKTRAGRGAATDPQSLYARKRRERINERLRILQNLVPNGTKVDISTMLEEAVHYVKFLKLQIKLLSSDDMWMYAPIAYNGMDMGLYQKINSSTQ